jgi:hypothetical protein
MYEPTFVYTSMPNLLLALLFSAPRQHLLDYNPIIVLALRAHPRRYGINYKVYDDLSNNIDFYNIVHGRGVRTVT